MQVIELPLTNPELFQRVGISPPKGCLLFGPPGTVTWSLSELGVFKLQTNGMKRNTKLVIVLTALHTFFEVQAERILKIILCLDNFYININVFIIVVA